MSNCHGEDTSDCVGDDPCDHDVNLTINHVETDNNPPGNFTNDSQLDTEESPPDLNIEGSPPDLNIEESLPDLNSEEPPHDLNIEESPPDLNTEEPPPDLNNYRPISITTA